MKSQRNLPWIFIGVIGVVTSIAMQSFAGTSESPAAIKTWEHLALTQDLKDIGAAAETSKKIMELGDAGWELVDVANIIDAGSTVKTVHYFKRPK